MTEKKYFQKLCVEHTNKEHRGLVAAFQGRDDDSGQGGSWHLDRGTHARKYSQEAILGFGVGLSERKQEIERLGMIS